MQLGGIGGGCLLAWGHFKHFHPEGAPPPQAAGGAALIRLRPGPHDHLRGGLQVRAPRGR
eukprot:71271-Prorocentrum_minimum.AAC.1